MSKILNKTIKPSAKFTLTPLGLLTLAACGGGGGGGGSNSTPLSVTVSGNAVAGPIDGAVAFVDYNENGILDASDEPYMYTDGNGAFLLTSTDFDAPIVVTTDSATAGGLSINAIDGSSSTSLSGLTLKAPNGSTVVSPTSTVAYDLIKTNSLTEAQVATALGLDGVSILSFNPYEAGVDANTALAVEKVASQVMTTVKTIAAAAEGSGANAEDAANQAFDSIVTVLQSKVSSSETLNFANTTDLTSVETQAKSKLASLSGIDTSSFNTILDTAMDSVKLVNDVINNITDTDLTSNANKGVFAAADHLKTQTKTAATAEKATPGSGNQHITMNDADAVNTAINSATSNAAPTDISLSKTSIAENSSSLTFTATTTDDSSSSFTYALSGADASYFTLNSSTGVLTLKTSPNYETKSSYSITIKTSDDADIPKSYKEDFTINVTDVNEAPSFSSSSGTGSVAENADASTVIYTASASDPDITDSIIYSISGGDDASLVQIDSSTGKVTLRDPADKETNPSIDFIVKASDASDSTLSSTKSVSVTVTEKNELPSASSKTITLVENITKTFSSSDFGFSDPDGDSLTKIKIMAVHESDEGQLKLSGNIVAAGDEISLSDLSSLTYTPGIDEIGDAYARISFKVNDGNNYSESAKHIYINVEEAGLTSSSSLALKASAGSSGQSYRLLGESSGSDNIDNLMQASGWAKSNGDYGASSDIYLTYSFYQSGSSYSYVDTNELSSFSSIGQQSIKSAFNQIEKFTNLNFIEVDDTASTFGDIRLAQASERFFKAAFGSNDILGIGFPAGVGSLFDTDSQSDINGDVFLASYSDTQYASQGSLINNIVMHEIGHALSLAHPFHASIMNPEFIFGSNSDQGSTERDSAIFTVMSYGFNSNNNGGMNESDPSSSTFMVDDVRALQHLYGIDKSFSAGNNIYDYSMFSSDNSGFIRSIYDYSGTDTIDFSNQLFQTRGTLNTNDYLFIDGNLANGTITSTADSDILNLTNFEGVLGMANTYIEQFFGGGGSDEITAGLSGSILFGGFSGNTTDALTAGSGSDEILLYDHGFIASKTECDTVKSFNTSNDKIGLEFGLTFSDLSFEDSGSDCYIKNASGSYLMKLEEVSSSSLTESVFLSTAYLEKSLGVLENNAPVILSGSTLKVSTDSRIVGYVNSSDADNDRLFYRLAETGDYNSVSINSSTGLITLSNTLGNAETKKITVEVSDGIAKTSKIFTIEGTIDSGVVSVLDREIEVNDTLVQANSITLDKSIKGKTSSSSDADYFKFTTEAAGTLGLSFTSESAEGLSHEVSLLNSSGVILSKVFINGNDNLSAEVSEAGSYYILINNSLDNNNYEIKATYSSTTGARETEANDTIATAYAITSGTAIIGQTSSKSDDDYYKLAVSAAGTISITFNDGDGSTVQSHNVSIVDASGNVLGKEVILDSGSLSSKIGTAGNYYVLINNSLDTKDYSLTATFSETSTSREAEPNNSIATADNISSGVAISGQTASYSDDDYYKLALSAAGTISVSFTGDSSNYSYHSVSILDENGKVLTSDRLNGSGSLNTEVSSSGNYYVLVDNSFDTEDYSLTATYSSTTGARETEANDTIATADTITSGTAIAGQTSSLSDDDYYKLVLSAAGTISVAFHDGDGNSYRDHDVSIVDANGNILAKESIYKSDIFTTEVNSSGNYYVLVDNSFDTEDYRLTATYSSTTGARETEANDTIATADTITSGTAVAGQTSSSTDDDYYKLVLSNAGTISVAFNDGYGSTYLDHDVSIVDASGNILAKESIYETGTVSTEVGSSGNYYVLVDNSFDKRDYSLTATYSSTTGARETEANDTIATADTITSGTAIAGQTSSSTDDDYYKLVLSNAGTISVDFNDGNGSAYLDHDVSIVDASGNILAKESIYESGTVSTEVGSSGNYYVLVDGSYDTEDYSLTATYSSTTGSRETESNNTIATADTITSGTSIEGQISSSSDDDYYKIALSAAGTISVAFNDGDGSAYLDHDVSIIDASGNIMSKKSIYENGTVTAEVGSSGNYFVLVDGSYDTEDYNLTAILNSTTGVRETETNNSIATADNIVAGTSITGQSSSSYDKDYFKADISGASTARFSFTSDSSDYSSHTVIVYNSSGSVITSERVNGNTSVDITFSEATTIYGLVGNSYDTEDYSISYQIV